MTDHEGSSPMFAIFALAIMSVVLVPVTLYRLCSTSSEVVQPWLAEHQRRRGLGARLRQQLTTGNVILAVGWLGFFLLAWYASSAASDTAVFNPFEILKVSDSATEAEIKRAYRQLSVQWHPDKNKSPEAPEVFLRITQAYKALTDEVARENYKLYGHPDGQQRPSVGVALPEIFFTLDAKQAPYMLGALVSCTILLPLVLVSFYLLRSNKYSGGVMQETLEMFIRSKFGIKESQSLARIPETLVVAMEFITLPTPAEQQPAFEELRKRILRLHPDLKDKSQFWKRKASIVKVHMLLLAHLAREPVPEPLQADLKFVLKKSPLLLEEMVKLSSWPRNMYGHGWLAPMLGSVEMMQCLVQAMPLHVRKASPGKAATDTTMPLLQLPHFDGDLIKKLARKRVRTLQELTAIPSAERTELLLGLGLNSEQAAEVGAALLAVPTVILSASCAVEGEEGGDIQEGDLVTCTVKAVLARPSHATVGFNPDVALKGTGVQAYAPHFPHAKTERWYFLLADPASNFTWSWAVTDLLEAEALGAKYMAKLLEARPKANGEAARIKGPANGSAMPSAAEPEDKENKRPLAMLEGEILSAGGSSSGAAGAPSAGPTAEGAGAGREAVGQKVELRFRAPTAGRHQLVLYCLSDCWTSCDRQIPITLKIAEMSRAEREGRVQRPGRPAAERPELAGPGAEEDRDEDGDEDEEDEEDEEEYDSEESDSEESGDEGGDKGGDSDEE